MSHLDPSGLAYMENTTADLISKPEQEQELGTSAKAMTVKLMEMQGAEM